MKVYFYFPLLILISLFMAGCWWDKNIAEYNIENLWGTGGMKILSGTISLSNSENIAYISTFSGNVILDNMEAVSGSILHENSILTTLSWSEVEIIFTDNSIVRLAENSRLQISLKWKDNTSLDLQEWSLWARVLKPFTDLSFFTFETDDLSAGVRGTSLWIFTNSGWTDIGIVDTTSIDWQMSWALIEMKDKIYYGSGNIHLSEEEILIGRHLRPLEHKKMALSEQMRIHPFIEINTIRDIKYMNTLLQDTTHTGTTDRIRREMEVTMPNSDEIILFLADPIIRSQIKNLNNKNLSPNQFLYYLDLNEKIKRIISSNIKDSDKDTAIREIQKRLLNPETPISWTWEDTVPIIIQPIKRQWGGVSPNSQTTTSSSISGERLIKTNIIPCVPKVSGEPCR